MKVLYIAPYRDGTGWSHSAINNILALDSVNIDVVPRYLKLNNINGEVPNRIKELEEQSSKGCNFVIQNSLPHHFVNDKRFKNIGCYFTETSHFKNSSWTEHINMMDAAWVPCKQNKEASLNSGVTIPIEVINVPCDTSKYQLNYDKLDIPHFKNKYVFYWMGEFTRRKNLLAVLKAFHLEFKPDEPVELLIKTSVPGLNQQESYQAISNVCNELKRNLKLYKDESTYIGETIICKRLSETEICSLHKTCNCFVATSYGEGWNIPLFDAMSFGNMVIASNTSGHRAFVGPDDLVKTNREFVVGMTGSAIGDIYVGNEEWDSIDINELRKKMRISFYISKTDEYKDKCNDNFKKSYNFSYQVIGSKMKKCLSSM